MSSKYSASSSTASEPNASRSGRPANGSTPVTFASSTAPLTSRAIPSGDRSDVEVLAVRCPPSASKNTRSPIAREPDSVSSSTSPMRTCTENSSPSNATASASVAPARRAISTACSASVLNPVATPTSFAPALIVPYRPRSCGRASLSACPLPPARSAHSSRTCQCPRRAQDHSRPWTHTSATPVRCRSASHPSPVP